MFEQSTDGPSELKVFIGGIPLEWDEAEVGRFMQQFGAVEKVRINRDESSKPKGFGFVTLSSHVDPTLIYGKHSSHAHSIEIKQLLQKCLYLLLPGPDSLSSEQISAYFDSLPYPLESVDPMYSSGSQNCYVKVSFTRDHNLKAIIDKRFIDIDGVRVEVTDHLEKHGKQGKHGNPAKSSSGKNKKKSHAHQHPARLDYAGYDAHLELAEQDSRPAPIRQFDSASSSAFKSIVQTTEDARFSGAVLDSDFSSRSKRKLSFGKGKAIEGFVPQFYDKSASYSVTQSTPDFSQKLGALPFGPVVPPNYPLHHMNVWPSNIVQSPNYPSPLAASLSAIPLHGYSSSRAWTADLPVTKKEPTISFFTFPGRD
jgi:RNA recognition motif-containing protein